MFSEFKYDSIPLSEIDLDDRNPRIVTLKKLGTQEEIVKYMFDHEDLSDFIAKVVAEGKNPGAERPYVVKTKSGYTVIEGNTRIAAYKVLTGMLKPPIEYKGSVPKLSRTILDSMKVVDCSIAPNRDVLLPIVANAHFGRGDKSKWGYLGSRKAVFDEWELGKTVPQLSKLFGRPISEINDLILEYKLYLEALKVRWTDEEKQKLLDPAVEFNPPVRFLQTRGHKDQLGIKYDKINHAITFANAEARKRFKHLINKLVINPVGGLGATASYDEVYKDYKIKGSSISAAAAKSTAPSSSGQSNATTKESKSKSKPYQLFSYSAKINSGLIVQLMKESNDIHCKNLPASGTFLLRNIVEAILKHHIDEQKANKTGKLLDLEGCLNLVAGQGVAMSIDDKKVLKEFQKTHLSYVNLGAHGTIIPNFDRLKAARDCVDQFVKRNVK